MTNFKKLSDENALAELLVALSENSTIINDTVCASCKSVHGCVPDGEPCRYTKLEMVKKWLESEDDLITK